MIQGIRAKGKILLRILLQNVGNSDLIVYELTSRIGRRNSRYHGDRVYQIIAYSEIETESFKQLQLRTLALHTF